MDNNELWDRPTESKRAYRRRMRERKIKRLFKKMKLDDWRFNMPNWDIYRTWTCTEYDEVINEIWRDAVRLVNAPAYCNKACCVNPRKYYKGSDFFEKTIQEKINKEKYRQQMKELDNE